MTPQEKELIQNVANKLKQSTTKTKDADAEQLIKNEIAAQDDAVYKLTQAVLIQELALKELKQKNDFLEQTAEYYKTESQRGTLSRMMGGSRPAPVAPQPTQSSGGFGSFMQTAAGVAVGMVAGSMITNALFGDDKAQEAAPADVAAAANTTSTENAPETSTTDSSATNASPEAAEMQQPSTPDTAEAAPSGFLDNASGFGSDYTNNTAGFGDAGFTNTDFGNYDSNSFTNNAGFGDADSFGDFEDDI